jgi:hypothetical protein
MERQVHPRVYFIGLDSLTERAIRAGQPGAQFRRLRPVREATTRRRGPAPHVVVLDLTRTHALRERALVKRSWGEQVVIVGLSRRDPMARVWRESTTLVELGPGFLTPFLPVALSTVAGQPYTLLRSVWRPVKENRAILYPIAAGLIALTEARLGLVLGFYLLVLLLIASIARRRQAAI